MNFDKINNCENGKKPIIIIFVCQVFGFHGERQMH